ncbi:hypothetical protein ALC57_07833 [Trachymyrmex cornetzi]|uniref:Uncharacterized protein n=1 Tax=Trachymyrmex cornetzi TaxID=471704 RepID=A0A195E3R5_9HYME|nr:hypothetical protein ALC57_07833 [Trachymyrmex cornetzi]
MISHACGSRTLRSNLMARPLSHRNLRSPTRVRRRNRNASSFPGEIILRKINVHEHAVVTQRVCVAKGERWIGARLQEEKKETFQGAVQRGDITRGGGKGGSAEHRERRRRGGEKVRAKWRQEAREEAAETQVEEAAGEEPRGDTRRGHAWKRGQWERERKRMRG